MELPRDIAQRIERRWFARYIQNALRAQSATRNPSRRSTKHTVPPAAQQDPVLPRK